MKIIVNLGALARKVVVVVVVKSAAMNFDIPPGLTDLLQDFTVSVLRNRPTDLYQFAADYFADAYQHRVAGDDNDSQTNLRTKGITFGASNDLKHTSTHSESSDDELIGRSHSYNSLNSHFEVYPGRLEGLSCSFVA